MKVERSAAEPFEARYGGVCPACDGPIKLGQGVQSARVTFDNGSTLTGWVHGPACPEEIEPPRDARCPSCGLEHRGECF